ncbi:ParA family protein [Pengzhenrongella sp.]|uniref:ParA family protein n=1 Tax=Pengzhenrongella sp. TaxID=2888820 RepID=UPI002F952256
MREAPPLDRELLQRVIAVINGKGGVGKTTIAANVAALLARSGWRVLVVDMDPQGNLGLDLGYSGTDDDDDGASLAAALLFGQAVEPLRTVRDNLDVLRGGDALHSTQAGLAASSGRSTTAAVLALANVLVPIAGDYDVIIIDCPPGNDALQSAAIAAARWVVVPSRVDSGSQKGLEDVARRLDSVLALNPDVDLLGVALFDVDTTATRVHAKARTMVADTLGSESIVFTTTVRHSSAVAQEVRDRRVLVHELDEFVRQGPEWWKVRRGEASAAQVGPRSATSVADDLHALTSEIIARLTAKEEAAV